jgi:broad specificity phosphatase PhoE
MTTTILLIRHGLTDAVGRTIAGSAAGWPLNAAGHRQAADVAARLAELPLAAVVASPLERTRQTAEPIAGAHRLTVEDDPAFVEFDFGRWQGRTFASLDPDDEWQRFNAIRSVTPAPGGESMLDVQRRAIAGLVRLRDRFADRTVAVVSHGDVIRAMVMYVLGIPLDFVHRMEIGPARVSVVQFTRGGVNVRQVNGDSVPPAG